MDPILKPNEVTDQCTLSPYKFPEMTEICEEELSSSYENYQESVFRSLSSNFDNESNINTVNEAYDNLEKCFIENNVLTKHGISKFKASASTKLLLKYRDIEDAFADMVFTENARKRIDCNETAKKIDLKRFKDDVFPIKLYDFPMSDNEDSQSNSEGIEDSESLFGSFLSENEVSDHEEICANEIPSIIDVTNGFKSEYSLSAHSTQVADKSEAESNDQLQQLNNSASPLKNTIRDIRVVVEKLPEDISDVSINGEDDNSCISLTESDKRTSVKETRQVARKRTGGMVSNTVNDVNLISKEQKIIQQLSSKDGDFVPSVFDKMTRAGKRDLERVLAESTANLVIQKTSQLITEKIKELRPCDNQTDSGSSEDEDAESDIHKTAEIVTNTIIEFLTKSKCKKLEKLGKDISDEICSKLNNLKFGNEAGITASDPEANQTQIPIKSNSSAESKVEKCVENKSIKLSGDILEEVSSLKRITREASRKKNNAAPSENAITVYEMTRNDNEMHDEMKMGGVDLNNRDSDVEEPRRPETRQSKQRQDEDTKNMGGRDSFRDEPRRPETRQSKQKLDEEAKYLPEKDFGYDESRRLTRISKQKLEDEKNFLARESINSDTKRPETRQSKLKQDDIKANTAELVSKVTVNPIVKVKRKKAPKTKRRKFSNKHTGKNISTIGQLIDGQFLIDSELNEETPFSHSSPNKVLKTPEEFSVNASPPFAEGTILKASADSTTFDTNLINEECNTNVVNDNCSDESNSEKAGEVMQPKEGTANISTICSETCASFELPCSRVRKISAISTEDVQCHSSQDENSCQYSLAFNNFKQTISYRQSDEQISNTVDSTNKKLGNDINNGLFHINEHRNNLLENISLVDTSKIEKILNEDETSKQKLNEKQDSVKNTNSLPSTCVPSQLLNDIITKIEKDTEGSSDIRGLQEIGRVAPNENTDALADSTSFLNYTLEDSFRLIVDECTPKEEAEKKAQCNEEPNSNICLKKQNNESTSQIEIDKLVNKKDFSKDQGILLEQEKQRQKDADKDDNEANVKNYENKTSEKHSTSEKPDNKEGSIPKPLTNEEKIARITNRDPRLVNDKKMVNVLIRDPRLRNKLPKLEESQEKPFQPKPLQPLVLDGPQSPDPNPDIEPIKARMKVEQIIEEKKTLLQCDAKTIELSDSDINRKKKLKKEIDEELLYKTPLSDLHASTSTDRPTYIRNIKPKRQAHTIRKEKDINEDGQRSVNQRRNRTFEESIEERRNEENLGGYKEPELLEDNPHSRYYNHGSTFIDRNFRIPHNEEVNNGLEDHYYGGNCERRDFQSVRQDYQSGSRQNFEAEGYVRRITPNSERRDFPDNQFYSRREFYRRNKYSHDHDHFSNSSRFVDVREETPFRNQNESFVVPEDSIFRASAYPPVSLLPDPMYSQEEDFDQSFSNMDTDSFSPPSSDLCPPPPPLIRPPTPDRLRRESFCPSPPRIGRASPDRDYEHYNRSFHRNYDRNERSSRGRNTFSRENTNPRSYRGGNYRRGNGRDHRRNEESPPRKRFITEHFGGREDDRGRRRRSPSWSPDRSRRWSSDRSLSPPEQPLWERSPPEPRPWDSPPTTAPPRRSDHYRERSQSFKNYRRY